MTKEEVIKLIADNVKVSLCGYGTWEIKSVMTFPVIDDSEDDKVVVLRKITHNEEDKTGIFDGEKYNTFCGWNSFDELMQAVGNGTDAKEYQDSVWQDTANEDNYEPADQRNRRLAEDLYEILCDKEYFDSLKITE